MSSCLDGNVSSTNEDCDMIVDMPECTGKYVTSVIDGKEYCRKNGSLLKHLRANGYDYESYYNRFYQVAKRCVHCDDIATFVTKTMSYNDVCGSDVCRGKQISLSKQSRSDHQWNAQLDAFRLTMSQKSSDDLDTIKKNRVDTYKLRHGVDHRLQLNVSKESLSKLSDKEWMHNQHITLKKTAVKISEELSVGITTATNWLHRHNIDIQIYRSSQTERDVVEAIRMIDPTILIKTNDRTAISPNELDILLPDYCIAIEIDGTYWHGETKGKDRRYHLDKTHLCELAGIRLIHITDSEWYTNRDIVISRLASILGKSDRIYARKCDIRKVESSDMRNFYNLSHIQGHANASICYGLYYSDELVAAMSFGVPRFASGVDYELIRYSNMLNTTVVGGASKLLKHFTTNHKPSSIISYSDSRWNTGNLYTTIGFKFSHKSTPNYHYFKTSNPLQLFSRNAFQKHKLRDKLEIFDPAMSEWKNMLRNGYDRIWDCGNNVYRWNVNDCGIVQ